MSKGAWCVLALVALVVGSGCGAPPDHPPTIEEASRTAPFRAPTRTASAEDGGAACETSEAPCAARQGGSTAASAGPSTGAGKQKLGSGCSFSRECVTGAWCGSTRSCEPVVEVWGGSCEEDAQCGSLFCVADASSSSHCGLSPTPCTTADDCGESQQACETSARAACRASCTKGMCNVTRQ